MKESAASNQAHTRGLFSKKDSSMAQAVEKEIRNHPDTCTCWECQGDPFAGIPDNEPQGFGACETEEYPGHAREDLDTDTDISDPYDIEYDVP